MRLDGRTALVTGASSGIGAETALGLARLGARVGLVGRDPRRTEAAAARIRRETGGAAEVFVADLASQAEIRRLAGAVRARYPSLDILVNNAGAIFSERSLTVDGIERTWALDHLAYVLLTHELYGALAPGARIVNLASAAHTRGKIDFDDLGGERRYSAMKAYAQAKLGNVLFTSALARHLSGSGITVNAVHPGVVASNFAKNTSGVLGFAWGLIRPFLISPQDGAKTSLHVATAPELEGVSGRYFAKCRETPSSALSRDEALQERVWTLSRRQVGIEAGGV
ncbi:MULTISPECIES: SDR family oxidoreductase [unclassified Methylobacterium]|uniref:SDR family oxidoreductase n=1 Tax=unclassified Methylobacterium TaxID=2615210 RepID=UPI0036FFBEA5